jgi:hypothetical protein
MITSLIALTIESLNDTSFNDYKKSIIDDAFIEDRLSVDHH